MSLQQRKVKFDEEDQGAIQLMGNNGAPAMEYI